jgi:ribose transport system permease protein
MTIDKEPQMPSSDTTASTTEGTLQARGTARHPVTEQPRKDWFRLLTNFGALALLLALILVFSTVSPDTFPTQQNFRTIVSQDSVLVILALAAIAPLIVGEFDLSIPYTLGLCSVLTAKLVSGGLQVPFALVIVACIGVMVGCVNAFLVVRLRLSSFIATLATGIIMSGIGIWISGGVSIFKNIGSDLTNLGNSTLFGVLPIGGVYFLVLGLVLWYLYERTVTGRQMYATGFARQAARLSGIRTERLVVVAFALAGLLAALAGALQTARLGSATPSVGPEYLLPAFAAAFLGATAIRPGRFNVWGTVLGVFLISVGITGLRQLGAAGYIEPVFNGVVLVTAVALSQQGMRRAKAV